jgi:hypothetical protein
LARIVVVIGWAQSSFVEKEKANGKEDPRCRSTCGPNEPASYISDEMHRNFHKSDLQIA